MLTFLGSALGFGASFLPTLLEFFSTARDQKHELSIIQLQMEQSQREHAMRLDAVLAEGEQMENVARQRAASVSSGNRFIDGYRASVRPTIAYIFMLLFVAVEVCLVWQMLSNGRDIVDALPAIWNDETHAIFASIIAFYFGTRTFSRGLR